MVSNDTIPVIDDSFFHQSADWSEFYSGACEKMPSNSLEPHDEAVNLYCFCDSDHAGDQIDLQILVQDQNFSELHFNHLS